MLGAAIRFVAVKAERATQKQWRWLDTFRLPQHGFKGSAHCMERLTFNGRFLWLGKCGDERQWPVQRKEQMPAIAAPANMADLAPRDPHPWLGKPFPKWAQLVLYAGPMARLPDCIGLAQVKGKRQ